MTFSPSALNVSQYVLSAIDSPPGEDSPFWPTDPSLGGLKRSFAAEPAVRAGAQTDYRPKHLLKNSGSGRKRGTNRRNCEVSSCAGSTHLDKCCPGGCLTEVFDLPPVQPIRT